MVMVLMDNLLDPTLPAIDAGARRRGDAEWKDDILDRILPGRSVSTNEALHRVMTRRSFFALVDDSPIGQQDIDNAVADIAAAAEEGDAEAQYSMGVLHGAVVSGEDASRVEWYRHAAAQGHAAAQASLGASYFIGLGVQQNYTEGLRWLLRSAPARACKDANTRWVRCMSTRGWGLIRTRAEAVRWYRLAAAQGYDVPEHMRPADTAKRCSRSALRGGAAGGSPTVAGSGAGGVGAPASGSRVSGAPVAGAGIAAAGVGAALGLITGVTSTGTPSQPGPRCAGGGATSWPPSSSVRPSRRSCAPIPPSSPRPTSPGASAAGLASDLPGGRGSRLRRRGRAPRRGARRRR